MGCEDVKWSCGEGVMWREREERAEEGEGGARGVVVDLRYPNGMYFVSGI